MKAFRAAVEARDSGAIEELLSEDVVFTSPVVFRSYPGKAITAAILRNVLEVFENFRYEREVVDEGGRDVVLIFRAEVGGREVHGCDILHLGEDGLIDDFAVMVRPLSGAQALAAAMGARFDRIVAEAASVASASSVASAASASSVASAPAVDGSSGRR